MADSYLTTRNLETKYQIGRATIKKWRDAGMPFHQFGKTIRFIEKEVEDWLRKVNK